MSPQVQNEGGKPSKVSLAFITFVGVPCGVNPLMKHQGCGPTEGLPTLSTCKRIF